MATRIAPSADVSQDAALGEGTSIWHLAQVREHAVLGRDCIVGRGAYIGEGVVMGDNCKVQNYALVYEPARLADGVFIGPAVTLTNDHFPRAVNPDGTLKSASDWEPVGVTIDEGASIGARAVCVAPGARGGLGHSGRRRRRHQGRTRPRPGRRSSRPPHRLGGAGRRAAGPGRGRPRWRPALVLPRLRDPVPRSRL
ncbi:hypothetical protein HMPREF0975_01993 [Actinomyces sp. oral taxon 849 str. F0330]|nr:hypothetical protein HMPREF0975_01993 [Actinomyces sp. oral taxon 849 str. F0330]